MHLGHGASIRLSWLGLVVSFILSHAGSPVNRTGLKCAYPGMNGFSCSFHMLTSAYPVSKEGLPVPSSATNGSLSCQHA
jgi:hypothetical protein